MDATYLDAKDVDLMSASTLIVIDGGYDQRVYVWPDGMAIRTTATDTGVMARWGDVVEEYKTTSPRVAATLFRDKHLARHQSACGMTPPVRTGYHAAWR